MRLQIKKHRVTQKDFLVAAYQWLPREVIKATVKYWGDCWVLDATWYADGKKTGGAYMLTRKPRPEWDFLIGMAQQAALGIEQLVKRDIQPGQEIQLEPGETITGHDHTTHEKNDHA